MHLSQGMIKKLKKKTNSPFFNAKELAQIYQIENNPTKRVGIAIIELGGGYDISDLNAYWDYLGLTTKPNVYAISVDNTSNSPGSDADSEVVLDIEIVGGICPNSNIYVYFAPNTDKGFYDAINAAINSTKYPVSVVSISWGSPENYWDESTVDSMNDLFKKAASKGITVCVASGDNGSSDGEPSGNHVDFPASSPWVLACGGTRLTCPSLKYSLSNTKEIVWGTVPNNGAAGGGFSAIFERPSYQKNALENYKNNNRGVPDVCGNADPETGWIIYINGDFNVVGGTSAVAPMWAAYLASSQYSGFANDKIYQLYESDKSIVHDITVGNEGAYSAAKYWDPASGLGSPNGSVLTKLLK